MASWTEAFERRPPALLINAHRDGGPRGIGSPRPLSRHTSSLHEREQIRVEHLGVDGQHAVRIPRIGLQRAILHELDG